ncbi:MAG TPA: hypothetical protein VM871_01815 [Flavisolibacter sp.]|nr:hypothetical protein [Flavisolibacter sp.]
MTVYSGLRGLVTLFFISAFLIACGQTSQNKQDGETPVIHTDKIQFDTSKTAVISFTLGENYPFDSSYKPAALTRDEIQIIDSLLIKCVADYNNSLPERFKHNRINLTEKSYKKQLVAVTNKDGDKEVWVNCFCDTLNKNWRKEILLVQDGGRCYFNFKINLTQNKCYHLIVNGES